MTVKAIPEAALALHTAILGMTGSGKTNTSKVAIDQVHAAGARVCILDPIKSDWWGITSSADGKRPGLPFHILGGPRGHVPLHSGAGAAIGELVAKGQLRHSIIDMAQFEPGGQVSFFNDFAPALLREMRGFMYLVMEEAHMFAPKERGGVGNENMAVHWSKLLATAGRSKGIRLIVATQRTQALHNAVLGSCQTLIAHQLTAPADQEPVIKWLKANIREAETRDQVTDSLGSLELGEAWLVSGAARLAEMRRLPKAATYDNTATPTDDDTQHEVATASVDRDALQSILSKALRQVDEQETAKLKKRVRELVNAGVLDPGFLGDEAATEPRDAAVDDEALEDAERRGYERGKVEGTRLQSESILTLLHAIGDARAEHHERFAALENFANAIAAAASLKYPPNDEDHAQPPLKTAPPPAEYSLRPRSDPSRQARNIPGTGKVSGPQHRILNALAWLESAGISSADRVRAAMFADQSSRSSGYEKNVSTLKTAGLIDYPAPGVLCLTEAGRVIAEKPDRPMTTAALHEAIRRHVSGPQWAILAALVEAYPTALKREELAKRARQSAASSGFEKNVSTMRSVGFIDYPKAGEVVGLPVLFIKGRK